MTGGEFIGSIDSVPCCVTPTSTPLCGVTQHGTDSTDPINCPPSISQIFIKIKGLIIKPAKPVTIYSQVKLFALILTAFQALLP